MDSKKAKIKYKKKKKLYTIDSLRYPTVVAIKKKTPRKAETCNSSDLMSKAEGEHWLIPYLRFHANGLLGSTGIDHPKSDGAEVKRGRVLILDEREFQTQLRGRCCRCVKLRPGRAT